jgi:hypothetical protein
VLRIHHEKPKVIVGRIEGKRFNEIIVEADFYAYRWPTESLLAICAGREWALSFVAAVRKSEGDLIPRVEDLVVEYQKVRPFIREINGGWFKFDDPQLHSSAHFGSHVDGTAEFQRGEALGKITALYYPHAYEGSVELPIMVSSSGTIVLQRRVETLDMELAIVADVYGFLKAHDAIGVKPPPVRRPRSSARTASRGLIPAPESLELEFEETEESEP